MRLELFGHDFEVFGYTVDVKTSRDVSAFLPQILYENDPDDDTIVMAWHRDNEDALMLMEGSDTHASLEDRDDRRIRGRDTEQT